MPHLFTKEPMICNQDHRAQPCTAELRQDSQAPTTALIILLKDNHLRILLTLEVALSSHPISNRIQVTILQVIVPVR